MKLNESNILNGALKALESILAELPGAERMQVHLEQPGLSDAEVIVAWGSVKLRLSLEVMVQAQPSKVADKLKRMGVRDPGVHRTPTLGVICAPFVSEESAKLCKDAGAGYIDLCGNCRLVADGLYIAREGRPNQYPEKRERKTMAGLFSTKASRVLKVLLRRLERPWKLQEAADIAQVSLALTFKVARMLEDQGWAKGRRGDFIVTAPEDLLKAWAKQYRRRETGRLQAYAFDAAGMTEKWTTNDTKVAAKNDEILRDQRIQFETRSAVVLGMLRNEFALGAYSAAEYLAPSVNFSTATIYVAGDPGRYLAHMDLKAVEKGGNVELVEPEDKWLFEDRVGAHGRWVTSPVQTYLDLMQEPVRGPDAAAAILERLRDLNRELWAQHV